MILRDHTKPDYRARISREELTISTNARKSVIHDAQPKPALTTRAGAPARRRAGYR